MDNGAAFEFYKKVLKRNKYCTISTCSLKGKPESAVMNYAETKEGKIYFYCFDDFRKYPNLIENPRISIVVYNHPDYIQIDGSITCLRGDKAKKAKEELTS
ncbi:MAG: pyridoxamine 5'-phosphate oxidase family protein [Candidatus Pacearchaeota archaeon]|nr:pyridoxamine 5'-phosphate oxidase family protein [Candidatus Pacearchaeota archaeon]